MNKLRAEVHAALRRSALAHLAQAAVCAAARLPKSLILQRGRGDSETAFARQVAMYLAHVAFGLTMTQVGHSFGRDRTTVRHACALVEDRRDLPAFELALAALETGMHKLASMLADAVGQEVTR